MPLGRYGAQPAEVVELAKQLRELNHVCLQGVFTHLSAGPADQRLARRQLAAFLAPLDELARQGVRIPIRHAASSATLLTIPEARLDMVRIGTMIYGQSHQQLPAGLELKPVWALKSRITDIQRYPRGARLGYGHGVLLKRDTTAAVVPVGYAEGFGMEPARAAETLAELLRNCVNQLLRFLRHPRVVEHVEVNSRPAPVLGRVGMQHTTIDVTDLAVQVGDPVTIPVRRILVGAHVPRRFFGEEALMREIKRIARGETDAAAEVASSIG